MLKSLLLLHRANLGFDPKNLLTLRFFLNPSKYSEAQRKHFFQQVVEQIGGLPGVQSVGLTIPAPLPGPGRPTNFIIEGRPEPTPAEMPEALSCFADSNFFATLGIPLLKGRGFIDSDRREGAPPVVIVSASMARRFWPDGDPLGNRIKTWAAEARLIGSRL